MVDENINYKKLIVDYFRDCEVNRKDGSIMYSPLLIKTDERNEVCIIIHGETICRESSDGSVSNNFLWYRIWLRIMKRGVNGLLDDNNILNR